MDDRLGKVLIVDDDLHINELIDMYYKVEGIELKNVSMEMMHVILFQQKILD